MTPAQQAISSMRHRGFTDEQINSALSPLAESMRNRGFSDDQISEAFGFDAGSGSSDSIVREFLLSSAKQAVSGEGDVRQPEDLTIFEALSAGVQGSVFGLALNEQLPDITAENGTTFDRFLSGVTQFAIDSPLFAIGALAGLPEGFGVLSPVTSAAGAFALPAALRSVLVQTYEKGQATTFAEFWDKLTTASIDTFKGAATGAAVGLAGPIAGAAAKPVGAGLETAFALSSSKAVQAAAPFVKPAIATGATKTAEIATLASVGAGLEGRVPNLQDFVDTTALIVGLHVGRAATGRVKARVKKSMFSIFENTGRHPDAILEDIMRDPTIVEDMVSENHSALPRAYKDTRPPEKSEIAKVVEEASVGTIGGMFSGATKRAKIVSEEAPSSALEEVKGHISFDAPQEKIPFKLRLNRLYKDVFEKAHFFNRNVKAMEKGLKPGKLPIDENPAAALKLEPGVTEAANDAIENGPRVTDTSARASRGAAEILRDWNKTEGAEIEDMAAYLTARRVVELENARDAKIERRELPEDIGDKNPISSIGRDLAERAVGEKFERYEQYALELDAFRDAGLERLRTAGVLDDATLEVFEEFGKNHVPLKRVFEDEETPITAKGGTGRNLSNPIFSFKGSEREIINPIESILQNTYIFYQIAARNDTHLKFVDLVERTGAAGIAKLVESKVRPITVEPKEIKRIVDKWQREVVELTEEEAGILEAFAEDSFSIFRKSASRPGDNTLVVFRDGVREVWKVDPDTYDAFSHATSATNDIVVNVMKRVATSVRAGSVLTLDFIVRNPQRDIFTSFILSKNKGRFISDAMSGFASVAKGDEWASLFRSSGAASASMVSLDRLYLQKGVGDIMRQGHFDKVRGAIAHPFETLRILSEFTESGVRVGSFKRSIIEQREQPIKEIDPLSVSKQEVIRAAIEGRDSTIDFAVQGAKSQYINRVVPFFSASLNGQMRLAKAFVDNPVGTMSRITSSIIIPSAVLHWMNRGEDWYENEAEWRKDLFWLVRVNGRTIAVPKPFEVGVIFGTGTEKFMDWVLEKDQHAFDDWMKSVFRGALPTFTPAVFVPPIETFANRTIFFDQPLIPSSVERGLPEYQSTRYTTEIAKILGRTVASIPALKRSSFASPIVIENYVRGWSGGLGIQTLRAVDMALRAAGVTKPKDFVEPEMSVFDLPGVRAVFIRDPGISAAPVGEFFERYKKNEEVISTLSNLRSQGNLEAIQRERKIFGKAGTVSLRKYRAAIGRTMKALRAVWSKDLDMTQDERQQLSDYYTQMVIATAKRANEQIDLLEKQDNLLEELRGIE